MTRHKILGGIDDARQWAGAARARGQRIAFTNGVFDLLHNGHLDSLRRARGDADLLVVGVNDDAGVRRLKGPGRPILPQDQRLRVLAALEVVDAVVPFGEDTPLRLIEAVAPDILAKGGHYTVPEIVGHEFVLERGGQVLSLPLAGEWSTTNLVAEIQRRFPAQTGAAG